MKSLLAFLLILIFAVSIYPIQIIYLKNGDIIKGRIVFQNEKKIKVKIETITMDIEKKSILKIETKPDKQINILTKKNEQNDTKWGAFWRSALLPSWGQFYSGKNTKAWIILGTTTVSLTGFILSYANFSSDKNKYESLITHDQDIYDKMVSSRNTAILFSVISAIVWIYNIADTLFFPPSMTKINSQKQQAMNIPSNSGLYLAFFSKRF